MTKRAKRSKAPPTYLDMKVEYVDPRTIKRDPRNPRTISPENRAALKRGIAQFGLSEPFIVRAEDGELIGGHQRLSVAMEEGFDQVPIVRRAGLSKAQARALGILLNNPKAQGQFVEEDLRAVLGELDDEGLLDATGFDDDDLLEMMTDEPEITEHDAPEAPAMAWWLVGVPIASAIDVGDTIERLSDVPEVHIYATVSSEKPRKPQKKSTKHDG